MLEGAAVRPRTLRHGSLGRTAYPRVCSLYAAGRSSEGSERMQASR